MFNFSCSFILKRVAKLVLKFKSITDGIRKYLQNFVNNYVLNSMN